MTLFNHHNKKSTKNSSGTAQSVRRIKFGRSASMLAVFLLTPIVAVAALGGQQAAHTNQVVTEDDANRAKTEAEIKAPEQTPEPAPVAAPDVKTEVKSSDKTGTKVDVWVNGEHISVPPNENYQRTVTQDDGVKTEVNVNHQGTASNSSSTTTSINSQSTSFSSVNGGGVSVQSNSTNTFTSH